jgi:TM2 domain-containing membrane protein YozV
MQGQILYYWPQNNEGVISADGGNRYTLFVAAWKDTMIRPATGMRVDFELLGETASNIYRIQATQGIPGIQGTAAITNTKSPIAAGLLAIFLGGLGIHKFYLGYVGPGVALLISSAVSFFLSLVLIGFFFLFASSVFVLIEGIIYITKPEAEFQRIYVDQKRAWF